MRFSKLEMDLRIAEYEHAKFTLEGGIVKGTFKFGFLDLERAISVRNFD